jgi:hypothetical protein
MRKTFLVLFTIGVLAVVLSAQTALDDYGRHPANKRQAVSLDMALKLMRGGWTEQQRSIILRAINSPSKDIESEASAVFTAQQMKDVFYNIGSVDVSDLRAVYGLAFGKGSLVAGWTAERKAGLWRDNFALGFVRFDLSAEQQGYLVSLAAALPLTRDQSVEWERRAVTLFTRDMGRALFATIGSAQCGVNAVARVGKVAMSPTCVCTTNAGNWSCRDSCGGGGSCTVDPGNCGFLWLWDCNGMCNNGDKEIQ